MRGGCERDEGGMREGRWRVDGGCIYSTLHIFTGHVCVELLDYTVMCTLFLGWIAAEPESAPMHSGPFAGTCA